MESFMPMDQSDDRAISAVRLLGVSGSLRRESYSTAILRELQSELDGGLHLHVVVPRLPLYDQDEEDGEALAAVTAFREAVGAADGLVICTPEYNHGVPGVLKNALDWLSRPSAQSVLRDKPVLIISNSPGFTGGVRAQAQLNETFLATHSLILPGRQIVIGGIANKMQDGRFIDRSNLSFALAAIHRLANYCRSAEAAKGGGWQDQ
jgi:chromate reductase